MRRRPANQGLFNGYWLDMAGNRIRRIRQAEYGELYRLHRVHRDIRLGLAPVSMRGAALHGNLNPGAD